MDNLTPQATVDFRTTQNTPATAQPAPSHFLLILMILLAVFTVALSAMHGIEVIIPGKPTIFFSNIFP